MADVSPGTRLGPYEILAPLGAGGMGEVFRAKDTRLDRMVAVKILPSHLSSNPAFRERFDREARAISALSHPHICTLFDVGHQDGVDYLVMEYLEGESLADRIAKGPLPLDQMIRYGAQIAEALDRAHRQGVIHRDLKPGNVMITKAGAKLLDFGLAKSAMTDAQLGGVSTFAGATQQKPLTEQGAILGTFQYMAPEQLDGMEADARTDIFALGAVLYEMLTGRRAFEGKTKTSLIAAIVDRDPPPVSQIQPFTPPALERVVRKCLAKDPDERWQSAHDVATELKWLAEGGAEAAARPSRRSARLPWIVAALLAAALATVSALYVRQMKVEPATVRFGVYPPPNTSWTSFNSLSISPDGRYLVFFAAGKDPRGMLFIRRMDTLETQALPGTEDASFPFWSPDSRWVGFFVPGKLKKISASGGPPQTLCDVRGGGYRGGTWNRDGVILYAPDPSLPIHRVSESGGIPAPVLELDKARGETQSWPKFLGDGNYFVYRSRGEKSTIYIASLDRKEPPRPLLEADAVAFAPPDQMLFLREGTPFVQRFNARTRKLEGEALPVAEDLGYNPGTGYAAFACSENGTLIYRRSGTEINDFVWYDRSGKELSRTPVGKPAAFPTLSPDGKRVAFAAVDPDSETADIWIGDIARGTAARFTFDKNDEFAPVWSPDGSRLAYTIDPGTQPQRLIVKSISGAGGDSPLLQTHLVFASSWSPDGRFLLASERRSVTDNVWDIVKVDLANGQRTPIVANPPNEFSPALSNDGKWFAYHAYDRGAPAVYVEPFPPTGAKWQIGEGGVQALWRSDGKELYYLRQIDLQMMAVSISTDGGEIQASAPQPLFQTRVSNFDGFGHYDVTGDGQRFLVAGDPVNIQVEPIAVVMNWKPERKQ